MALSEEALARLHGDARQILARYPQPRSALLPLLHLVQSEEGWVSPEGVELCAGWLGLTPAEVVAVSTFYSMYRRKPGGAYQVGVCTNTLCGVLGGDAILERLEEHLGVEHGETTPDGSITLEHLECNAACDYAPVVMVNWEFFDNQTPSSATDLVDALRAGQPPAPSRGATRLCSFREIERVLAGFDDGLAAEGTGAGEPSLAGLRLARQRGWSAPAGPSRGRANGDGSAPGTGYGPEGGPSGDDAPAHTAVSDPANPTPASPSEGGGAEKKAQL